ncbi:MAG: bifunctional hydroxymethylpyrimidine kinase/phosphomethylpyrimidine kinase [Hyphomicrobium sp.]|jgi:hydroxymethylpyrimidine/phosphomethylpyrimidine kinase
MSQDVAADRTPVALTIAGSDSSGGAGIQADLKTFTVLGVYGASVVTALTAQSTRGVSGILAVPPDFVRDQIDAVADDFAIGAVKTGMLNDRETVVAVVNALKHHELRPLVVDPVIVATSGDSLLAPDAVQAMRDELIPRADILTPNLHEAARLLDQPVAKDEAGMLAQARALLRLGCKAVVIKGGHGEGAEAVDLLVEADAVTRLALPRITTRNTHGTGCTFSAAIVANLAQGVPIKQAVSDAKRFVHEALQAGARLALGKGAGPVDVLRAVQKRSQRC